MKVNMLFKPGKIGNLEIRNRVVMAPMGARGLVELDGRFSQRAIDYYAARAEGGTGLIETSVMLVDVEIERRSSGPWSPRPRADSPLYIARLYELANAVHDYGAKIASQLTAGYGRNAQGEIMNSGWAIAPSSQPCFFNPKITARGISTEEVEKLVKAFGVAAKIIKTSEFDAIEIHGHEGYLIDEFMTAKWNKRTDRYGGNLDRRLRFPLEIIESIRKAVGPDFPVIFRMAGRHYIEGGRDLDESILIAKRFENAGVHCLHIDSGCYESSNWAHPPLYAERGCNVDLAAAIKKEVKIPVIAVGRLGYPELAEKVLAEGKADFIALGRPLLADPEWANKAQEGRFDDIRPCIGCHDACQSEGKYISCTVNPQTGMERELNIQPAPQKKSVLVIGGGPAGLEAARVAALRGHQVTLWERSGRLGGNLIPASIPAFKSDIQELMSYLISQNKKLGVRIKLNKEATPRLVNNSKVDDVVIATGAQFIIPKISGCKRKQVVTPNDVLMGKREAGHNVVVIGGCVIGCETALWLAQQGKKVTIAETREEVLVDVFRANKQQLLKMLAESGVTIMTGVEIAEITNKGITIKDSRGEKSIEAETVVIAVGLKSENTLIDELDRTRFAVHSVGDCVDPRNVKGAIWDAFRLARRI